MMDDIKRIVCEAIYRFILYELPDRIDKTIFEKSSTEAVGQYLFDIILQNVDGASEELIKFVIEQTGEKNVSYTSLNDHYKQLCCYHMHFKELPQKVYYEVIRKFVKIFRKKYPQLLSEINAQIATIDVEMGQAINQINNITHNININLTITKNIKDTERLLSDLYWKCDELRTKKEMLEFSLGYLDECMTKFCDLADRTDVLETLRKMTLSIATGISLGVESEFQYYDEIISITKDQTRDIFCMFYIVKLLKLYEEVRKKTYAITYRYDELPQEVVDEIKQELDRIPQIVDLACAKSLDKQKYKEQLLYIVELNGTTQGLREQINNCVSIGKRKMFIFNLLDLFDHGEFDLFNNTVPIQIEGLFSDFLKDGTVFYRFTNMQLLYKAVLKEKISYIKCLGLDVYPEAMMYFGIYFNNLMRNKIAHGTYSYENNDDAEIFALELLLDLEYLIYMISRKSETEKMYRVLHKYKSYMAEFFDSPNHHFRFLYNDLTGQRVHSTYDALDTIRPIQFAYWILNPYYEELFSRVGDVEDLRALRTDFLCNEFWAFVLDELEEVAASGIGKASINRELCSVVNCLFRCDISAQTRATLGKVNEKLSQIFVG